MKLSVIAAEELLYEGDALSVSLPGSQGELGIFPMHTALITTLSPGTLRIQTDEGEDIVFVSGGVVEVKANEVIVLVDMAVRGRDIDEARALAAKAAAEKLLASHSADIDYAAANAELLQAVAMLKTLRKVRKH